MSPHAGPKLVVGIGASAGGLDALRELLHALPERAGLAYVVVQHLAPDHDSHLVELLSKVTALPVETANNGVRLEPDHIYVIRPGTLLEAVDGRLRTSASKIAASERWPVDVLFRSLARAYAERAVGIVLSGSGRDGVLGLRAIRAARGFGIAQSPATAKHDGMPSAAIQDDVVDRALDPDAIPPVLIGLAEHPFSAAAVAKSGDAGDTRGLVSDEVLSQIRELLTQLGVVDARAFKAGTLTRRTRKRMMLHGLHEGAQYLAHLTESEAERRELVRELLIGVTEFFRDPKSWEALEREVLPKLLADRPEGQPVRAWVAGCATGEEAYTLAMVLADALADAGGDPPPVQIFATDVDEQSLAVARRAIYPPVALQAVGAARRDRYFFATDDGRLQVRPAVRDTVSFAQHDLTSHPPFLRLELVTCRNVLIYVRPERQEQVLESFHFALRPYGALFLGDSESAERTPGRFAPASGAGRIFLAQPTDGFRRGVFKGATGRRSVPPAPPRRRAPPASSADALRALLPPSLVVSTEGEVLHLHGELSPFLRFPSGAPTKDVFALLPQGLRTRVRAATHKAEAECAASVVLSSEPDDQGRRIRVDVRPVAQAGEIQVAMGFGFASAPTDPEAAVSNDRELEQELERLQADLRYTVEELESANQELQASHEEANSFNEELQATNEELEATTEELRSLNEELSTVNTQLREKVTELQRANNDLVNFFASTDLATIFLNDDQRLERFSPAARRILKLDDSDVGRRLSDLGASLLNSDLPQRVADVLTTLGPHEDEVSNHAGRWYVRRVLPYRTQDRQIRGVVVNFLDVTEARATREALARRHAQQHVLARLGVAALAIREPQALMDQVIAEASGALHADFAKVLEYDPERKDFLVRAGSGWRPDVVGGARVPGGLDSQAGYTLSVPEPVVVQDLREEQRFRGPQLLHDHGVVSGISCVIGGPGRAFGVLGVHTKAQRRFDDNDANFLVACASLLAHALDRVGAEADVARSRARAEAERARLERLFLDAPALIGIHEGPEHVFTFSNRLLDRVFGLRKLVGRPLRVAIPELEASGHAARFDRVYETGEAVHVPELPLHVAPEDGVEREPRYFSQILQPYFDAEGQLVGVMSFAFDVTAQVEARRRLEEGEVRARQQAAELTALYETAPIGLAVIGRNGLYERVNRHLAAIDLDGGERHIGSTADLGPGANKNLPDLVRRVFDSGESLLEEELDLREGETRRHFLASFVPLLGEDRGVRAVSAVVQETTQQKRYQLALETAAQQKDDFMAMLGHELRTPLAAIRSAVDLLGIDEPEGPTDRPGLRALDRQTRHMTRLVDDLLDASRVSRGKIQIEETILDLGDVLARVVEDQRSAADDKGIGFSYVPPSEPISVRGDAIRLAQIFGNLVSNALRFTPRGGEVKLSARASRRHAWVEVEDDGEGIAPDLVPHLFEAFRQGAQPLSRDTGGLGLGLALAQRLTALHGGTIQVHSEGPGRGATFTVELPRQQEAAPAPPQEGSAAVDGRRILVVEDNEDLAELLVHLLRADGHDVRAVHDGPAAITTVLADAPDLLLCDLGLPGGMTGYDVAEQLRADGPERIRLVAMSGYGSAEDKRRAQEAGFDLHLNKPVSLASLRRTLRDLDA